MIPPDVQVIQSNGNECIVEPGDSVAGNIQEAQIRRRFMNRPLMSAS